jgi:hypothetical protein
MAAKKPAPTPSAPPTTLEALDALLARLRAMRVGGLDYEEEMKSVKEERALLRERSTMEARLRLTESSIVREHPAWLSLRDRIVGVLSRHPQALADVIAAIDAPDAP